MRTSTNHSPQPRACALLHRTHRYRARTAGVNRASVPATAASEETYPSRRKYISPTERAGGQYRSDGLKMCEWDRELVSVPGQVLAGKRAAFRAVDSGLAERLQRGALRSCRRRHCCCCYNVRAGREDLCRQSLEGPRLYHGGYRVAGGSHGRHHYRETQGKMLKACRSAIG